MQMQAAAKKKRMRAIIDEYHGRRIKIPGSSMELQLRGAYCMTVIYYLNSK